jgi:hypothetical protein
MSKVKDNTPFSNGMALPISVGLGAIKGMTSLGVSSIKVNPPALTEVDMVPFTDTYVFPSDSGEAMEIVSDNVGDISFVNVLGLDENGLDVAIIIQVNGTTPVALPGLWSRINFAFVAAIDAAGFISVRGAGGGTVYEQIDPVHQRSFKSVYTVPANKRAMVMDLSQSMIKAGGTNSSMLIKFTLRGRGGVFLTQVVTGLQRDGDSTVTLTNAAPAPIPPLTDIKFTLEGSSASMDTLARVSIFLFDNDVFLD